MNRYQQIEHTADIGILVEGQDIQELFANAGFAFFDLTWELEAVEERLFYPLELEEESLTDLLIGFLRELLYLNQAEDYIFKRFEIKAASDTRLEALAFGEKYDPGRHKGKEEIKGVTYHQARVEKKGDRYQARVIFDI